MHLDYQYYAGDSHQFLVGIAHGLSLLANSLAPCWADRESWDEWLLMELRHRYLALCGLAVHLHAVHASIGDLDACYDPGRFHCGSFSPRPGWLSCACALHFLAPRTVSLGCPSSQLVVY